MQPLLIDLGLLAPHGSAAAMAPQGARFLALPAQTQLNRLRAAKVNFEVNLYSGTTHGFTHPQNPSEERADAQYKVAMARFLKDVLAQQREPFIR